MCYYYIMEGGRNIKGAIEKAEKLRKKIGRSKVGKDLKKVDDFLKKSKVISKTAGVADALHVPYAREVTGVSKVLGYGKKRGKKKGVKKVGAKKKPGRPKGSKNKVKKKV